MDYIILSALLGITLSLVILTYDIACQWSKNFKKRMAAFPEHMRVGGQTRIEAAIPSWHINGHGQSCRCKGTASLVQPSARLASP